jgi:hypothetical protein
MCEFRSSNFTSTKVAVKSLLVYSYGCGVARVNGHIQAEKIGVPTMDVERIRSSPIGSVTPITVEQ